MPRIFLVPAAAALAALTACGAALYVPPADSGSDTAPPMPVTRTLTFGALAAVRLEPRAMTTVSVTLRDESGGPVAGQIVHLALTGDAQDAALSDTAPVTAADGHVEITLQASSSAATMNVRARADRAADALLEVSVSDRGFGSLDVMPRYTGVRAPTGFTVQLFDAVPCSALSGGEPVRSASLPAAGGTVVFGSLAAGASFTVRGLALGTSSDPVATACVEGLSVGRDQQLEVPLSFEDLPLAISGAYTLRLGYDLGTVPASAALQWRASVHALSDGAIYGPGDASYLLAAIGDAIDVDVHAADRTAFDTVVRDHLLADVTADLLRRSASPDAALDHLAADTASVTENVVATLALESTPTMTGGAMLRATIETLHVNPLTPDVGSDDLALGIAPSQLGAPGTIEVLASDRVHVSFGDIGLPFPGVARRAADALLAREGAMSATEWAELTTGCAHVASVVHGATGTTCGDACVEAACMAAVARLGAAFDASLATVDADLTDVSLAFDAPAHGVAGSLRVGGTAGTTAFSGLFVGARPLPVQGVAVLTTTD